MYVMTCKGCQGQVDYTGIDSFTICECSLCGSELTVPKIINDYLVLETPLPSKACFEVYEGFSLSDNVGSVIYLMPISEENQEYLDAIKDDSKAISNLKHANITPIIEQGEIGDYFFVSEPQMDGYPVSDYIPESQSLLDIQKVVDVIQAVTLGLAIAHNKELPHHDICSENIHIDSRGNVRIKNFFISRFLMQYENSKEVRPSVSPYFISPEKAESRLEDKRGDIFSLGVLFYFMLTGKYPFSGSTDTETVYSRVVKKEKPEKEIFIATSSRRTSADIEYTPPVPPSEIRKEICTELSCLVMEMLEYLPFKRPALPEILDVISLYKARDAQEKVRSKQKEMMTTTTKAIPKMKGPKKINGKKKKKKKFFL